MLIASRRFYQKESAPMDTLNSTVVIPLSKGFAAIVDAIDSDLLNYKWQVRTLSNYAARGEGPRRNHKKLYMHRVILERVLGRPLASGECVDHINGYVRDNRRSNLRLATHAENMRNQRRNKANTTGRKGVSVDKKRTLTPYRAYITIGGKQQYLGHFDNFEDACKARQEAEIAHFGKFRRDG